MPDAIKHISSMGWLLSEGCHFAISLLRLCLNVILSVKPSIQEANVLSPMLSNALGLNSKMLKHNSFINVPDSPTGLSSS